MNFRDLNDSASRSSKPTETLCKGQFRNRARTGIALAMRPQYDLIAEYAARGPVLAIGSCMGFGVRIAGEKLGVPIVTIHFQPAVLWSQYESPTLPTDVSMPASASRSV